MEGDRQLASVSLLSGTFFQRLEELKLLSGVIQGTKRALVLRFAFAMEGELQDLCCEMVSLL